MKIRQIISSFILLILVLSGCRDITVTTRINKDGTFTRLITITGDSADLFNKDLPYPIDETWRMETKRDTVDSSLFVTYTKTFENADLLNKEIQSDTGWMKQIKREINIKKRFGFFYSYLSFNENIKAANPFQKIPIGDQLTAEEIKWLKNEVQPVTPADSSKRDDIEEKAMQMVARSMAKEIMEILEDGIRRLKDPELSPQIVITYHDSILKKVDNWEFDSSKDFITSLATWSGRKKLLEIENNSTDLCKAFDSKITFFSHLIEMNDFEQTVEMPGLVTETNSLSLKGNQVEWKVEPLSFLLTDYTMYVESRVVNYWMFVLTGVIVLALLILLLIKSFR